MGIFSAIRDAILPGRDKPAATAPRPATTTPRAPGGATATGTATAPRPAPQPQAMDADDVETRLDAMPGADNLNWRTSIVDLMKLIGVDASYENRKELAQELGRADYDGSADDNIWLHRKTMQELAKAGGKVPKSFLD